MARVIEHTLSTRNSPPPVCDLDSRPDHKAFLKLLQKAGARACLFIGSPVYRDLAVPPVMTFIDGLPNMAGATAVPFVTWGGACSGIALWQMGTALVAKGFQLVGAAKVIGIHSMMWQSEDPVGFGHPDSEDDRLIETLTMDVQEQFHAENPRFLYPDELIYQSVTHVSEMKKKVGQPWIVVPKTVDEEQCSECGVCESECPAGAITLNPYPVFGIQCFDCFNCVRLCPEGAIDPAMPLEDIEKHIRKRVATFNEKPLTELFVKKITPA